MSRPTGPRFLPIAMTDRPDPRLQRTPTGHTGRVESVALGTAPDGHLIAVTGSLDDTVRVWDITTGSHLGQPLTGHPAPVKSVALGTAPDGHLIAVATSGQSWTSFEVLGL